MIPVLGVPVLNRPDLAARMVRSIDYPVAELVVIVNGDDRDIIPPIRNATDMNPNILKVLWSRPGFNLGCGASWNFIIRSRPAGPWWVIVNADIVFGPGDLERLSEFMSDQAGPVMGTVFEFGAFAINSGCVDTVGFFDENFFPMYYEDRDYEHRMKVAGVPYVRVEAATTHDTSSTIRSNGVYMSRNNETFMENGRYYGEKWGGSPYSERFNIPYGDGRPVCLDRNRLVRQAW